MSNWRSTGAAPLTSVFNAMINLADSTGVMVLDKTSAGDGDKWVEYDPSWKETTNRLFIKTFDSFSARPGFVQIGVGTVGNERAILELPGTSYGGRHYVNLVVPITIREGERVSVKVEAGFAATSFFSMVGWNDPLQRTDLRYYDVMGQVAIDELTIPDPGGTLNTKGAWLELVASTANNYKSLIVTLNGPSSFESTVVEHVFDLGIGIVSSEVVVIKDMCARRTGTSMGRNISIVTYTVDAHIPSGVRLAVRCQADNTTVGQRDQTGMAVIGLY